MRKRTRAHDYLFAIFLVRSHFIIFVVIVITAMRCKQLLAIHSWNGVRIRKKIKCEMIFGAIGEFRLVLH